MPWFSSLLILIQIPQRAVTDPRPQEAIYDSLDPVENEVSVRVCVCAHVHTLCILSFGQLFQSYTVRLCNKKFIRLK